MTENVWFGIFCTQITLSSDEWQSKAQFNLQGSGENKTGYHAENIKIVSTNENFKKSPRLFTLHFYALLKMYCYAKQCYQVVITCLSCYISKCNGSQ